jgi:hypothetical protein
VSRNLHLFASFDHCSCCLLTRAGWYDLFSLGTFQAFEGYNQLSDPSVRYTSVITIDPLGHCLDGAGKKQYLYPFS